MANRRSPILASRRDNQIIDGDVFQLVEYVNHDAGDIVRRNSNPVQLLSSLTPFATEPLRAWLAQGTQINS